MISVEQYDHFFDPRQRCKKNKMRRLLNLNLSSIVFMRVIGFLIVILPALLYGILLLWRRTEIISTILLRMIHVSFVAGAFVLVVFLVLIVVEQVQDHYFDAQYQKQRGQKILLANGYYECQYCGNQRVQENHKTCEVCGKEFTSARSK
jgi:uncharacterized paraquat-inducible protein A